MAKSKAITELAKKYQVVDTDIMLNHKLIQDGSVVELSDDELDKFNNIIQYLKLIEE